MPREVRRRYVALRVEGVDTVDRRTLEGAIRAAILALFGEYGLSKVEFTVIECSGENAIVRCNHNALQMLRASTATITEIRGKPAAIRIVKVSGTLKALRRKTRSLFKPVDIVKPGDDNAVPDGPKREGVKSS